MKTLSIALAATLAVSSTAATAGNTNVAPNDATIIIPQVLPPAGSSVGSLGSLGTGGAIALGVLGVAAVVAATRSDGGS